MAGVAAASVDATPRRLLAAYRSILTRQSADGSDQPGRAPLVMRVPSSPAVVRNPV